MDVLESTLLLEPVYFCFTALVKLERNLQSIDHQYKSRAAQDTSKGITFATMCSPWEEHDMNSHKTRYFKRVKEELLTNFKMRNGYWTHKQTDNIFGYKKIYVQYNPSRDANIKELENKHLTTTENLSTNVTYKHQIPTAFRMLAIEKENWPTV